MIALVCFIWSVLTARLKPKSRLEVENAALRRQLVVLQRKVRGRIEFTNRDRQFFILLYRWCPSVLKAMVIVRPETVVRWHRALNIRSVFPGKTDVIDRSSVGNFEITF
jgi:hypothetical protein